MVCVIKFTFVTEIEVRFYTNEKGIFHIDLSKISRIKKNQSEK